MTLIAVLKCYSSIRDSPLFTAESNMSLTYQTVMRLAAVIRPQSLAFIRFITLNDGLHDSTVLKQRRYQGINCNLNPSKNKSGFDLNRTQR